MWLCTLQRLRSLSVQKSLVTLRNTNLKVVQFLETTCLGGCDQRQLRREACIVFMPVTLMTGDWIAVKVCEESSKSKKKGKSQISILLAYCSYWQYWWRLTVSFVKRQSSHSDIWYSWPLREDVSSVGCEELVKLCDHVQDIVSGFSTVVITKLYFDESGIDDARKMLNIPIRNILLNVNWPRQSERLRDSSYLQFNFFISMLSADCCSVDLD